MAPVQVLTIKIGGDIEEALKSVDRLKRRFTRAGDEMQSVGAQMTAGLTVPILGIGAAATKATADWETAMTNVAKTVDAPDAAINALGDDFVRLSEEIPVAASEFAGIAAEAGQLGIQLDNLEGFSEVVAALRVSTNLGEEAATTMARLANIMGTSQTDFDRMGSSIVALGNNLATTEAEIAEMALRIAGAGSTVGMTEAEVLSFAGALSSVGVRAEAGGTAISKVMIDIASAVEEGGAKLADFAEVAGESTGEFRKHFQEDAAGALQAFIAGLGRIKQSGTGLFGTLDRLGLAETRVRDALTRAAGAADLFNRSLDIGRRSWRQNIALTEEAERFYDRLGARLDTLVNKAANVTAEFGDALRPAIDLVIDGGKDLLDVVRFLVDEFAALPPFIRITAVGLAGIAAAAGPVVFVTGGFIKMLPLLAGGLGAVGTHLIPGGVLLVGLGLLAAGFLDAKRQAEAAGKAAEDATKKLMRTVSEFSPEAAERKLEHFDAVVADLEGQMNALTRQYIVAEAQMVGVGDQLQNQATPALRVNTDELRKQAAALAARIAPLRAYRDALEKEVAAHRAAAAANATPPIAVDPRAAELLREQAAAMDGLRGVAELTPNIRMASDEMTAMIEKAPQLDVVWNRTMVSMADVVFAAEGAFTGMVGSIVDGTESVGAAVANMAKRILADLARIIARMLFFRAILSLFPGVGQGLGIAAGSLFGGGAQFGGFTIPGLAAGGPVMAGRPYMVGEAGPELFVPSQAGSIVPNGGGGISADDVAADILGLLGSPPMPMTPEAVMATDWWQRAMGIGIRSLIDRGGRLQR